MAVFEDLSVTNKLGQTKHGLFRQSPSSLQHLFVKITSQDNVMKSICKTCRERKGRVSVKITLSRIHSVAICYTGGCLQIYLLIIIIVIFKDAFIGVKKKQNTSFIKMEKNHIIIKN